MIKFGRPYSNETSDGSIDDALITERSDEEITAVGKWIRDNIRPAKKILDGHTSYGMKHILKHDTGIYLTNNEFKDAMLLTGYKPVNPNELNWRYRIVLTRDINNNPSPFFNWAKKFAKEDNPYGDFAKDMLHEFDFPVLAEHDFILWYLKRKHACKEAKAVFEELWKMYQEESCSDKRRKS